MPYKEKDINSDYIYKHGKNIDRITVKEGKVFLHVPIFAKPIEIASNIELVFVYATTFEGSNHVLAIKEGELFINENGFYRTGKEDSINVLKLYIAI